MLNPTGALDLSTILGSQAVLAVISLGLIIPLTANDFDGSIAYVITLSAMMVTLLNGHDGWPVGCAVLAALGMGITVGSVNAFFITVFRIHLLIVTFGTGTFLHGVTLYDSDSMTISGISDGLINWIIVDRFIGIPQIFCYAPLLYIFVWYVFEFTLSAGRCCGGSLVRAVTLSQLVRGCEQQQF